jgi:hypothetical protein
LQFYALVDVRKQQNKKKKNKNEKVRRRKLIKVLTREREDADPLCFSVRQRDQANVKGKTKIGEFLGPTRETRSSNQALLLVFLFLRQTKHVRHNNSV